MLDWLMVENVARRQQLLDAGLQVLATQGSRGLTHRAVDALAEVPQGTSANYFRDRDTLLQSLGERIFERLTPPPDQLASSARKKPSRRRWIELMQELMQRVSAQPELQLAFLELRLESTRRPELERALTATVKTALAIDLDFHAKAGLAGGREEIVLLHLAIQGLILNLLTLPDALELSDPAAMIETLVTRLVPQAR